MSPKSFLRLAVHTQLLPILESGEETLVGGQAVMEGVMMRAPHSYCVAVRRPDGSVVTDESPLPRVSEKYPLFRFPILRGIGTLGQAMWLGVKALRFSAEAATVEDSPEVRSGKPEAQSAKPEAQSGKPEAQPAKPGEISGTAMGLNLLFSLGLFVFLYKFVPLYLATQLGKVYPLLQERIAFNLVDGLIRISIFLGFLFAISRLQDIRRVFQYHGAEHKVVFNFESGNPVTVSNARGFTTLHPRCGTSFLLVVMVLSMMVYTLLPVDSFAAKFALRIALMPFIVGISYELIRYAAKRQRSLMAFLTTPGLWLQKITTKPPSDEQTEIAIRALDGAMALEQKQGGELVIA